MFFQGQTITFTSRHSQYCLISQANEKETNPTQQWHVKGKRAYALNVDNAKTLLSKCSLPFLCFLNNFCLKKNKTKQNKKKKMFSTRNFKSLIGFPAYSSIFVFLFCFVLCCLMLCFYGNKIKSKVVDLYRRRSIKRYL